MTDNDKGKKTILFNATKKETHHPNSGFKKLFRRLKSNFKISANKDEVSRDRLAEADLLVFGGPSEPFTSAEFDELKAYLHGGGRALVMMGDGGEKQSGTNMNYLLEEFGMSVNPDRYTLLPPLSIHPIFRFLLFLFLSCFSVYYSFLSLSYIHYHNPIIILTNPLIYPIC